jgi:DNA-binding LacI/PurR family transcriptional regulator
MAWFLRVDRAGMQLHRALVTQADVTADGGAAVFHRPFGKLEVPPTALFVAADAMAQGAMRDLGHQFTQ